MPRSDYKPVILVCPNCGKVFETTEYRIRYGKKYCSRECGYTREHHAPQRPLEDRFWEKVQKSNDCWLWASAINNKGYGDFHIGYGKHKLAHRVAYELTYGDLPPNTILRHTCDNPKCVRPDHLIPGTMTDNQHDMAIKGRSCHGSKSYFAKLNETTVLAIRSDPDIGILPQWRIAEKYGISRATISNILTRHTWTHI
jgi:hypothetical protein